MKPYSAIVNPELREYVEQNVIPRYDCFDKAHQRDHVLMVIQQSLELAEKRHGGLRQHLP